MVRQMKKFWILLVFMLLLQASSSFAAVDLSIGGDRLVCVVEPGLGGREGHHVCYR